VSAQGDRPFFINSCLSRYALAQTGKQPEIVRLSGVSCDDISLLVSASRAQVNDLPAFFGVVLEAGWFHEPLAVALSITRKDIHMLGVQAKWTVVSVTPIVQWFNCCATILTTKAYVFSSSTHTHPPRF